MNIYFSPEYSGNVYLMPADGEGVLMDTMVAGTAALVSLLELRLGLHYDDVPKHERVAHYHDAMSRYVGLHPDCALAASFSTSGLRTAAAVLAWRDALRAAGWDFGGADVSRRMADLAGIEEIFRTTCPTDLAARLNDVVRLLDEGSLDCSAFTLLVPVDASLFRPAEQRLLAAMAKSGATIRRQTAASDERNNLAAVRACLEKGGGERLTLNPDDDSLQVWKFADEHAAHEYLAYQVEDDRAAWVNADNKQMDDWLQRFSHPCTGSKAKDSAPQLAQLFVAGVRLFFKPLDVSGLIDWLNMPLHPLGSYFCNRLAETIVRKGGYRNDACRDLIRRYEEGEFVYLDEEERSLPEEEQKALRMKDKEKREKKVAVFLPPLKAAGTPEAIDTEALRNFTKEVAAWSRSRVHMLSDTTSNRRRGEQLSVVAALADTFLILLDSVTDVTVPARLVDSWLSAVYQRSSFTAAEAEAECRYVVDNDAKLISVSDHTYRLGLDGDYTHAAECAFLFPSEKERLTAEGHLTPWDETARVRYYDAMDRMAFTKTRRRLVLVVCERRKGEVTQKHPFIVRLESHIANFDAIVRRPVIPDDCTTPIPVPKHEPIHGDEEIKDRYGFFNWPDHLSPTAVEELLQYPLDFLLDRLLGIRPLGKAQMSDVRQTTGNVAHAVIERLFSPRDGRRCAEAAEIEERVVGEYDTAFSEVLEAEGAILLLSENRLHTKTLRLRLRRCLGILLEILKDNDLRVTACERFVTAFMDLGLPEQKLVDEAHPRRDMLGFIDMTLEDADGRPVVFDFKWTTSKTWHEGLLRQNRSLQLALYGYMLSRAAKDEVHRTAYFLMPAGRLISYADFRGPHCTKVNPADADDLVACIRRSVLYRKRQIDSGIIETVGPCDLMQYQKDTEEQGLLPLKVGDDGNKEESTFTIYQNFYF